MINVIITWLQKIDVDVLYHQDTEKSNSYCPNKKTITILEIDDKERQLFSLLHEAGHAVLNWDKSFHKSIYPWKHHEDPHIDLWLRDLVQEEYDAWQEGYELAEKLSLNIDLQKYEQLAEECLNSYRGFAATVDNFSARAFDRTDDQFDTIFNHFAKTSFEADQR